MDSEEPTPALLLPELSGQEDELALPPITKPAKDVNELQQPQILPGEELPWFFPEEEFLRGRSAAYDPQGPGMQESWFFPEEEFLRSRSDIYDPQGTRAQAESFRS